MLTFTQFVLIIISIALLMIILFLITGIIYTKDGYVSVIEKKGKFYKLEKRKIAYYFPILYRKVNYYPITYKEYRINEQIILVKVNNVMLLYNKKINLKKLFKENKNLGLISKTYRINIKNK